MPASTVHHRVKKLEREGIIKKYTIELDEDKVGRGFTVYMMVTGRSDNYLGEDFFRKSEVAEVSAITGNFDLLIKFYRLKKLVWKKFFYNCLIVFL